MQNVNKIISDNFDKISALCASHKVRQMFAFGSVCTDRFSPSSDIDLLIAFEPMDFGDYADNYFRIAEEFERLLQRKVDLVTENSLANPFFIKAINRTKVKIYG
ncbi:nucleotidyltransferase family protein [Candidatus Electronema sp. PJ]|uniref:nucleotidyltransferase family protein n=1 Tax=Candidatus Electronema sp. PJ TaxID=3401572 RepID=UPI003AA9D5C1